MALSPSIQNSGGAIANLEDIRALAEAVTGVNGSTKTALFTVVLADHGKTFYLSNTTGFVTTLPALLDGFFVRFVMPAVEVASTNMTIIVPGGANIIEGVAACAADGAAVSFIADADRVSFVAGAAKQGDWVEFRCDGTNWYVSGLCILATGMTSDQIA